MKDETNRIRNKLDEKDIAPWKKLTHFTNQTAEVVWQLKKRFDPEMCTVAFCKMYEMLEHFDLIDRSLSHIKSVHICEVGTWTSFSPTQIPFPTALSPPLFFLCRHLVRLSQQPTTRSGRSTATAPSGTGLA